MLNIKEKLFEPSNVVIVGYKTIAEELNPDLEKDIFNRKMTRQSYETIDTTVKNTGMGEVFHSEREINMSIQEFFKSDLVDPNWYLTLSNKPEYIQVSDNIRTPYEVIVSSERDSEYKDWLVGSEELYHVKDYVKAYYKEG